MIQAAPARLYYEEGRKIAVRRALRLPIKELARASLRSFNQDLINKIRPGARYVCASAVHHLLNRKPSSEAVLLVVLPVQRTIGRRRACRSKPRLRCSVHVNRQRAVRSCDARKHEVQLDSAAGVERGEKRP